MIRHAWLLVAVAGCTPATVSLPERKPAEAVVEFGSAFDPATTGTIRGKLVHFGLLLPHAVVWLEAIEPARSKPWTTSKPTQVVLGATCFSGPIAEIVRLGDPVEFQSHRSKPVVIRGRGAMDFAIPLENNDRIGRRIAERSGIAELTVGGLYPLDRKHIFVAKSPYATMTDSDGAFEFVDVPSGTVELHVWAFNDRIVGHDRDPESGLICRFRYAEPVRWGGPVDVKAGQTTKAILNITLSP